MTRLRAAMRAVDVTDVALVVGLVLLWLGLGRVSEAVQYIVVGTLLAAYGLLPVLFAAIGRRR